MLSVVDLAIIMVPQPSFKVIGTPYIMCTITTGENIYVPHNGELDVDCVHRSPVINNRKKVAFGVKIKKTLLRVKLRRAKVELPGLADADPKMGGDNTKNKGRLRLRLWADIKIDIK